MKLIPFGLVFRDANPLDNHSSAPLETESKNDCRLHMLLVPEIDMRCFYSLLELLVTMRQREGSTAPDHGISKVRNHNGCYYGYESCR